MRYSDEELIRYLKELYTKLQKKEISLALSSWIRKAYFTLIGRLKIFNITLKVD